MSIVSEITRTIAGVEHSRYAATDSEVRALLLQYAEYEENLLIKARYEECAKCESLKEEFKLLGITMKDNTPVCNGCGCNMLLKIPLGMMECPEGKWSSI
jgi:hypothetical protein